MITWLKKHLAFDKNKDADIQLKESTRALKNPGCGWYHIYTFDLSKESSKESFYIDCEEEELVLLLIDIHAFRSCEQIPKEALEWFSSILTFFEQHDKGIILRIVYDTKGRGMENEPSSIKIVKSHMKQLGSIICEHTSEKKSLPGKILVHQGLFVGSWGEMHSSKFLSTAPMTELVQTLYEAIGGICPIAVRKPEQLRSIVEQLELEKKTAVSLTLFNDGIFGSETDLGTYGTEPRIDNSSNNRAWARQDELDWQETQMQRSFTGGEAVGMPDVINEVSPRSTANSLDSSLMIRELDQMHVSYLNSTYRQEQLNAWKNQSMTWNGETISVYDYIGRHLGYRFTVINVKQIKNKEAKKAPKDLQEQSSTDNISHYTMQITIRNTGFANLCEEAECKLLLVLPQVVEAFTQMPEQTSKQILVQRPKQKIQQEITINCDPRTWDSGRDTVIACSISTELWQPQKAQKQLQAANFYLQLTRKRDGRLISFANENTDVQFGLLLFIGKLASPPHMVG